MHGNRKSSSVFQNRFNGLIHFKTPSNHDRNFDDDSVQTIGAASSFVLYDH